MPSSSSAAQGASNNAGVRITFQQLITGAYGPSVDMVPFPSGLLKTFQRYWVQNCIAVPENQLEEIDFKLTSSSAGNGIVPSEGENNNNTVTFGDGEDDGGSLGGPKFTVNADKLTALIKAFVETRPPLCPVMAEIAAKHGSAGLGSIGSSAPNAAGKGTPSPAVVQAVEKALMALRDIGISYDELCKLPLAVNKATLLTAGLSEEVSTRIAGAIYKRRREAMDNDVHILTPRTTAVTALERFDRSVSFTQCRLCPDDIGHYLPSIAFNTELTRLDLSANNIHIKGAAALAATLAELPNLVALSLAGNNLQFEGLSLVLSRLQRRSAFDSLDISCNNGGVQTGAAIGNGFQVRSINVSGNRITAEGIVGLIPAARTAHSFIAASNNFGVADGNPSGLSDVGTAGRLLTTLISTAEHLTYVDISNNNLSTEASQIILEKAIATHPSLTGMELSLNAFDVAAVAAVVAASPQITHVGLGTEVTTASADAKALGSPFQQHLLPLTTALKENSVKMAEFRTFLAVQGIPHWTADNVRDALTYLMKRRDIAMQCPVNGALLVTIKGLGLDDRKMGGGGANGDAAPPASENAVVNAQTVGPAMDLTRFTFAPRGDFDALCDFLDQFREGNGDINLKASR